MKKDFRNHPFRVNDTVYHPVFGEGVIDDIEDEPLCIRVNFKINGIALIYELSVMFLSFTPYEINSCWDRPFEPLEEGDVLFIAGQDTRADRISIFKKPLGYYALYNIQRSKIFIQSDGVLFSADEKPRLATEDEKNILFDELERDGKRWNPDTMQVEDIPEPLEEGDLVISWGGILSEEEENTPIIGYLDDVNLGESEPFLVGGNYWENAVKFESFEQYEKIRRGEV